MRKPKRCCRCGNNRLKLKSKIRVNTELFYRQYSKDIMVEPYIYCPKCGVQYHPGNFYNLMFYTPEQIKNGAIERYNKTDWKRK